MATIKKLKNGKLSAEFNSVPEVFRVIDKLGWEPREEKASDDRGSSNFNTFGSLDEAITIFRDTPEKVRQFDWNDKRLKNRESPGIQVDYDVQGDYIDMGKFLSGEPEHFGFSVMGNPNTIFCTINVLTSYVYSTSQEFLVERQIRILRLVDWMESQGVRCQIVGTIDTEVMYGSVVVKQFRDPVDLNDLAVVSHPEWLRRIWFLLSEQSDTWQYGYGSSNEYDQKMKRYMPTPDDGLYVYVGGYLQNDVDKMHAQFDALEEKIYQIILDNQTFNTERLVIG